MGSWNNKQNYHFSTLAPYLVHVHMNVYVVYVYTWVAAVPWHPSPSYMYWVCGRVDWHCAASVGTSASRPGHVCRGGRWRKHDVVANHHQKKLSAVQICIERMHKRVMLCWQELVWSAQVIYVHLYVGCFSDQLCNTSLSVAHVSILVQRILGWRAISSQAIEELPVQNLTTPMCLSHKVYT